MKKNILGDLFSDVGDALSGGGDIDRAARNGFPHGSAFKGMSSRQERQCRKAMRGRQADVALLACAVIGVAAIAALTKK